jgi:hypothetical protein
MHRHNGIFNVIDGHRVVTLPHRRGLGEQLGRAGPPACGEVIIRIGGDLGECILRRLDRVEQLHELRVEPIAWWRPVRLLELMIAERENALGALDRNHSVFGAQSSDALGVAWRCRRVASRIRF